MYILAPELFWKYKGKNLSTVWEIQIYNFVFIKQIWRSFIFVKKKLKPTVHTGSRYTITFWDLTMVILYSKNRYSMWILKIFDLMNFVKKKFTYNK